MKKIGLFIFVIYFGVLNVNAQQQYPSFDIEQVSENVYLGIFHRPDNGARIGSKITIQKGNDGLLLVDGSFAQIYQLTRIKLKEFSDQPVKYVINTHFHVDHSGANGNFIKDGATIIAHDNIKKKLSTEQKGFGLSALGSEDVFPAVPKGDLPNKTFDQEMSLDFNGDTIQIVHYPSAHTNGDAIVYFEKANVYDMGDIIWPESFAFVDWYNGGSAKGLLDAVEDILKKSNKGTKYISGHGPVLNFEELNEYAKMLKTTIKIIDKKIKKGKTLAEIQSEGLPKEFESWSGALSPTNVWIEMIYKSKKE